MQDTPGLGPVLLPQAHKSPIDAAPRPHTLRPVPHIRALGTSSAPCCLSSCHCRPGTPGTPGLAWPSHTLRAGEARPGWSSSRPRGRGSYGQGGPPGSCRKAGSPEVADHLLATLAQPHPTPSSWRAKPWTNSEPGNQHGRCRAGQSKHPHSARPAALRDGPAAAQVPGEEPECEGRGGGSRGQRAGHKSAGSRAYHAWLPIPQCREPSLGDRERHPEGRGLRRVRLAWAWSLCLATAWLGESEQVSGPQAQQRPPEQPSGRVNGTRPMRETC